ncbi:MAG: GTPase RsgA, partial [Candidatus Kapaibacteriota bacterium]
MHYEGNFGEEFEWLPNEIRRQKRRVFVKKHKQSSREIYNGIVVTTKGRYYFVQKNDSKKEIFKCVISGSVEVKHSHNVLVTVGDRCDFLPPESKDDTEGLGRLIRVAERKTFLIRKSVISSQEDVIASNMDQVLIILAVDNPKYNLRLLDKILVACEYGGVTPIICVNKIDLYFDENVKENLNVYMKLGYKVVFISAKLSLGLEQIINEIQHKETLLIGVSGVG